MEGIFPGGPLYASMLAVQLGRFKEKAKKNTTFEKFQLVGFDPYIYTKWDLSCLECGKRVTHNAAKGTTTNLNDHLELHNPEGKQQKGKAAKD